MIKFLPLSRFVARPFIGLFFVLLVASSSCSSLIPEASFPTRPGTTWPGSMLGPFDGRVIDTDTKTPVEGATVWVNWVFTQRCDRRLPHQEYTATTKTDADGRYHIPKLTTLPWKRPTKLNAVVVTIHQRGYVVYRNDYVFNGTSTEKRHNFFQHDNHVLLHRWKENYSASAHLAFAGGNPTLRAELASMHEAAARELDEQQKVSDVAIAPTDTAESSPSQETNEAEALLDLETLRSITAFSGPIQVGPLADRGDTTATLHFRAEGLTERHDVAIRLWRLSGEPLSGKLEELRLILGNSRVHKGIGDRGFIVEQDDIYGLAFSSEAHRALILLTCGKGQCATQSVLETVAAAIASRLDRLPLTIESPGPLSAPTSAPTSTPTTSESNTSSTK